MTSSRLSSKPIHRHNMPKQYIQGWVEFYKLKFRVTPDVLIPRPETELLVDEVLDYMRSHLNRGRTSTIMDIGTGCGNIAISIAINAPDAKIIATDVSEPALKVAKQNAKLHGVSDKITFLQSNLLQNIPTIPDIIVTNLPYIPSARIPYLDSSVKDFEPLVALDGGADGFQLYRKLFAQISQLKWKPKLIVGEIDYTHGQLALDEAMKFFPQAQVEVKTDLAHKQRILVIQM